MFGPYLYIMLGPKFVLVQNLLGSHSFPLDFSFVAMDLHII